jgi:hypothetical protein
MIQPMNNIYVDAVEEDIPQNALPLRGLPVQINVPESVLLQVLSSCLRLIPKKI